MLKLGFLLCLFVLASANEDVAISKESRVVTANLNNYIDFIMPAIVKIIETTGLDPMTLPDVSERISIRPGLVTFHGDLKLTKGSLRNLKTLARAGDTTVSFGDKILKIRVDFGIKNLKIVYRYLAKIMGIGPTGGVTGIVSKLSMVLDVLIDFNKNQLELTEFKLHDLGKITVTMSGNPITDLLMNTIIHSVTNIFRNLIFNVVEKNIRNVLQDKIKELNASIGSKAFLKAIEMKLE